MTREFRYIAGLDLLRFLGALSVIALHLGSAAYFKRADLARFHVMVSGNTGVTLFYVISGFLITSLISVEVRRSGAFDIKGFFARRALRIFPLYYLALALYAACHLLGIQRFSGTSFLYAVAYSYNFIPKIHHDGWLGSFHTLATEEHFYLVYPLLWGLCLWRRVPMWVVLIALLGLSLVTPVLSRPFQNDYLVGRWTFNAWGPILIGGLFAEFHAMAGARHEGRHYFLGMFVLLFASQALVPNALNLSASFGFLVLHFACNQGSPVVAALGAPAVRYLGSISYGMYVWQSFIIGTGAAHSLIRNPWLAFITVMMMSALSWQFLEKPLSKVRQRMGRRR
ncbi:MAG: acyltransferase [Gammaproteobacteria bacterium]|nr:acyltransferase [Gammaproteobacteria bacterium]